MRRLSVPYLTASNGFEALQCYKSNDILFDIVLMDVSMPIMDGLTASREIRSFERIADRTPATIIALTGAASPQARQEAFASGIDRYLTKPVPMKVLKSILDEFQIRQPTRRGVDVDGQSSSGSQSGMKVSFEEASTSRPSPPWTWRGWNGFEDWRKAWWKLNHQPFELTPQCTYPLPMPWWVRMYGPTNTLWGNYEYCKNKYSR